MTRSISPETRELMHQLFQDSGWLNRFKANDRKVDLLRRIRDRNEPMVALELLPVVLDWSDDAAAAAADAIHHLVGSLDPRDLVALDERARQASDYWPSHRSPWFRLKPIDLHRLQRFGPASGSVLGLATFHANGYVRQTALELLDRSFGEEALGYLLLRANDWVEEVRSAALAALQRRFEAGAGSALVGNWPLVERLNRAGRWDHSRLVAAAETALKRPAARAALVDGLDSPDRVISGACFRLLLEAAPAEAPEILQRALDSRDPMIRLWAVRQAAGSLGNGDLHAIVDAAAADSFLAVRREALRAAIEGYPDEANARLEAALLDRAASIRSEARYGLRAIGVTDFAPRYREAIERGDAAHLEAAIQGLGETGQPSDATSVVPFLDHRLARVRRAAVTALSRLAGDQYVRALQRALEDDAPSVSRAAQRELSRRTHLIDAGAVWQLFRTDRRPHVRKNALSLLSHLGKWSSIPYLVDAVDDPDAQLSTYAQERVRQWINAFNRSFTQPTADQVARVRRSLDESSALDRKARRWLSSVLATFSAEHGS